MNLRFLGASVALVVLVSCGQNAIGQMLISAGSSLREASVAHADEDAGSSSPATPSATSATTATGCAQWQVKVFIADSLFAQDAQGEQIVRDVPEGWEPFAAHDNVITLRRCKR